MLALRAVDSVLRRKFSVLILSLLFSSKRKQNDVPALDDNMHSYSPWDQWVQKVNDEDQKVSFSS